ncbi:hypothetical protein D7V80_24930 [Corallococcus sp. CA054B]|uniref:hypothetical protein n=1 Tax=Corallococcus sp. CA054B TaxID=2316734 RepID=UPI000EA2337D|nr:hypothetical protein [Corallococcus sp. CA054B]RKG64971.1 hypothetical protein D7V80_24930 [Corallococcus sp. CA054B]
MASRSVRAICLLLLALMASSCSSGPCEDSKCHVPTPAPCGNDRDCGWHGFPAEPLAVPTLPRTGEIITLDGVAQYRAFALKTVSGRIYTFTCTAEGFEACQVTLEESPSFSRFVEQEGRTTRVHFRAPYDWGVQVFVTALPEGSTGTFQYSFSEREDDHGLDVAEATRLTPGAPPVQGLLQAGPDKDTFVFDATQGRIHEVRCAGAFPPGTPSTRLTGPDGRELDGNHTESASGLVPGRRFVARATGRHAFSLSSANPTATPYACSVEDLGLDDHGGSTDTATALPEGDSVPLEGTLELNSDLDLFSFLARAGHTYALRCDTPTFAPCRDARIYAPWDEIREQPTPVGVARDAWLQVPVAARGQRGAYALTLLDLGADQGTGAQDAVPLSGDVSLTGYLSHPGDEDFFRLDAVAGHVYRLEAEGAASVEALLLATPDASLTRNDITKVHHFLVDADAAVLLRVSGPRAQYRLDVRDVGRDDHAGTPSDATDPGGALSVTGVLNASTDVDWFALTLEARPHALSRTSVDTKFVLFEADGVTPVPWDTASGTWVPRAAGRHLLRADMFGRFQGPDAYRIELLPR